jgi:hypothetical protein
MERQFLWRVYFISLLFAFLLYSCSNSSGVEKDGLKVVHFQGTDVVRQTIEYKNGKKMAFLQSITGMEK